MCQKWFRNAMITLYKIDLLPLWISSKICRFKAGSTTSCTDETNLCWGKAKAWQQAMVKHRSLEEHIESSDIITHDTSLTHHKSLHGKIVFLRLASILFTHSSLLISFKSWTESNSSLASKSSGLDNVWEWTKVQHTHAYTPSHSRRKNKHGSLEQVVHHCHDQEPVHVFVTKIFCLRRDEECAPRRHWLA